MSANANTGDASDRTMNARLERIIASHRARAEALLTAHAATWEGPDRLLEAMRYAVLGGGKRLRPVMTLAACEGAGGDPALAEPAAVALELVHAYSLVHDDLPSMDDDETRRGQPTVHVVYGVANAILVGDALLTEAFATIARSDTPAQTRAASVASLSRAAGAAGMVGGQVRDIAASEPDEDGLLQMHAMKTGALFVSAAEMGAIAAGASQPATAALLRYASAFGRAFQIGDDLVDFLDLAADDEHERQVNLAASLGPELAAKRVAEAVAEGETALDALTGDVTTLRDLLLWCQDRSEDALARVR